jgi:hypothetical protein
MCRISQGQPPLVKDFTSTHHPHPSWAHNIPMKKYMGDYVITGYGEIDNRPYFDIELYGEKLTVRMNKKGTFIKGNEVDASSDFFRFHVLPLSSLRIGRICVYHISQKLFIQRELACGRVIEEIEVTVEDFQ